MDMGIVELGLAAFDGLMSFPYSQPHHFILAGFCIICFFAMFGFHLLLLLGSAERARSR
jgi:hypothetical protein